jgi:S1-C subfamily serine protease
MHKAIIATVFSLFIFVSVQGNEVPAPAPVPQVTLIPREMIQSTVRVRSYEDKECTQIKGMGSGVAVDLAPYGLPGRHYILTAAHVIWDDETNKLEQNLQIEVRSLDFKASAWVDVKVLACNNDEDLALLEIEADLPILAKIAQQDNLQPGDVLVAVGGPVGLWPVPTVGYFGGRNDSFPDRTENLWQSSNPIFGGNSGGPIFDLSRNEVVGIITRGARTSRGWAPNVSLFVPMTSIKMFVMTYQHKLQKEMKNERVPAKCEEVSRDVWAYNQ